MKIAILGFGLEGKAVLKYLKKSNRFKGADVLILDKKFNKDYLKNLDRFDIIFRSPGVPYNLPKIQKAIKKGVKFSGATKLFFEETEKIGCRIIGVTGTKGKGTTSTLLYKILKACGKNTHLAGNIGKPAIEILPKLNKNSIVILELSSFQLWDLNYSPDVAVILDIFPDHLDSHKNFSEYINAKANIAKRQKKSDRIFYETGNKWSRWIAQKSPGKKIAVLAHNFELFRQNDLKIAGEHNFRNAVMAASVALSFDCSKNKILKVIRNYRGLEHRLELIRVIRVNSRFWERVCFYNDSASTNPQTAIAAINAFPNQPKILIAGGKDKNLDYSLLAKALKNSNTKLVVLFGENKNKIKQQIANNKTQIVLEKDLKSAIQFTYKTAKSLITNYQLPITILFSPASASFDMFKDYKERGKKFKEIVKKLK